jgi:hypothetical protein
MNVKAEAMNLFGTAVYQQACAFIRQELTLPGMLDSWR